MRMQGGAVASAPSSGSSVFCRLSAETFPPHPDLVEVNIATDRMGQRLFRPPTVEGLARRTPSGSMGPRWLRGKISPPGSTSDESSVTAHHWHKTCPCANGLAGGDAELDFWTALFSQSIPDSAEHPGTRVQLN